MCHCGANIGRIVGVPSAVAYSPTLPNVVHIEESLFICSTEAAQKLSKSIREKGLNRVVVAACTPRTHEPLFRDTLREAGINQYFYDMTNIREHCSWGADLCGVSRLQYPPHIRLIPCIKLVERERLRVPLKLSATANPEKVHDKFFESDELNRLFNETIMDKLAISQIMLLLQEKPLSTGEISGKLGLNPSETARHMSSSSRHGLIRYDESRKGFALAQVQS
jgi:hypothetical protein